MKAKQNAARVLSKETPLKRQKKQEKENQKKLEKYRSNICRSSERIRRVIRVDGKTIIDKAKNEKKQQKGKAEGIGKISD